MSTIRVTAKIFGPLRDIVQQPEIQIDLPGSHTGEDAFAELAARFPQLHEWRNSVRLAVNLEYTHFNHPLKQGDEISFIPPVSGG